MTALERENKQNKPEKVARKGQTSKSHAALLGCRPLLTRSCSLFPFTSLAARSGGQTVEIDPWGSTVDGEAVNECRVFTLAMQSK